jgi:prolyl oligopeptidase
VDLLSEDPDSVLVATVTLDGPDLDEPLLAAVRTRHGVSEIHLHRLSNGHFVRTIELPGAGTIGAISERPEGGPEMWFTYTDHVRQSSVFKFDARDFSVTQWATPPGAVSVPAVLSQQVEYVSKDGTVVRMFIVSPANSVNGPRPTILYGYGGFGISLNPHFSAEILANIRGGGEEGEEWHRAGMFGNKQNVFDDFECAAEWLITHGVTTRAQLGIAGGSNGGLLVGAALTQRPDLYSAVVCSAPLLDMVRYELHGLGATWNVEYGTAISSGCTHTRLTTVYATRWPIHRCCSRFLMATHAWIHCTHVNFALRCNMQPRQSGRFSFGQKLKLGMASDQYQRAWR